MLVHYRINDQVRPNGRVFIVPLKKARLPGRAEMLRRLRDVSHDRMFVNKLYPLILAHAGEELDGHRTVQMLLRAVTECAEAQGYVPAAKIRMMEHIPSFAAALIQDAQVLRDANERLSALHLGNT
jgi:hypothetical protein